MMHTLGADGFMVDFLTFGWYIFQIVVFIYILNACRNIRRIADKYCQNTKQERASEMFETKEDIDKWLEGK